MLHALKSAVPEIGAPLLVAFSGGLDSTVLLHAAVQCWGSGKVVAAHVDHRLQPLSSSWTAQCAGQAHALGVRFLSCVLDDRPAHTNIEAWARRERYQALFRMAHECKAVALMTAHHADDQLETFLMALARGAGLNGLTGIAPEDRRDGVRLLRPLLDLPRSAIRAWAQAKSLRWIEDPMNEDPQLKRTELRKHLLPLIDEVLPGLRKHLPQALTDLRESRETLNESTQEDLASLQIAPRALHALDQQRLASWPQARQRRVLRAWIAGMGLGMPTRGRLEALRHQCLGAQSGHAEVLHEGWHLIRQGRRLLAWSAQAHPVWQAPAQPALLPVWDDDGIDLPDGSRLMAQPVDSGLCAEWLKGVRLSLVRPGASMRIRLRSNEPSRELRKRWQEEGVPVSVRGACALVLADGQPFWLMPFGQLAGDWPQARPGLRLVWQTGEGDPRQIAGDQGPKGVVHWGGRTPA